MATNLLHFRPSVVRASAIPNPSASSDNARRKPSSASWWTPLFGWSPEPDYIDSSTAGSKSPQNPDAGSEPERKAPPQRPSSRFTPGCFTEEKAKRLRMLTKDTSFHDIMYHSAIASRLASDFKDSSDLDP